MIRAVAAMWALWAVALVSHVMGNTTAINAVVGIGVAGLPLTAAALYDRRHSRRSAAEPRA